MRNQNPEYPWSVPVDEGGFSLYRSCHDTDWALTCAISDGMRAYHLVNTKTGEEIPIRTAGGVYTALDMAEAVICGSIEGTHDKNSFRS